MSWKHCRVAALVFALLLAAWALAEDWVTTTDSVSLRKGPGTDYAVVGTVAAGTRLSCDRTARDEFGVVWYRVKSEGKRGWVSALYAQEGADAAEEQLTTTSKAKLRSGPGGGYASRMVIEAGVALSYDKIAEDDFGEMWYRVTCEGKRGWISSRYVRRGEGDITGTVTTLGAANLRSGAGKGYGSRTTIPGGTTLSYDSTEQDERGAVWYRVSYEGRQGWVSSAQAVEDGEAAADNRVKTTGVARLRTGPGQDYAFWDTIDEGVTLNFDQFKEDERGVTWYHVVYDGVWGWVSSRFAQQD